MNSLFTASSFEPNFALVKGDNETDRLVIPEGTKMNHFLDWVKKLPENEPPHWLGLPKNAETLLKAARGREMLLKVRKMSNLSGEDDLVIDAADSSAAHEASASMPVWMRSLYESISRWMEALPSTIPALPSSVDDESKSPFHRFFERENDLASSLLKLVRSDLQSLSLVCKGEMKQTNHLRSLIGALTKGVSLML